LEFRANRYVVLYLATLIVLIPIDFLFLGTVAKRFFSFCRLLKHWTWPVVLVDVSGARS
jgi:hypothetical protein